MTGRAPDVIVVGAGGSGAVLAARLAERGERVLLLESGPVPAPDSTRDGASLAAAVPGHPLAVAYSGSLTPGRDHTVVRGRVAGGSTAINGGYFRRPRSNDLDDWARAAADERWSATATQPIWARVEADREFGRAPGHGSDGPMPVTRGDTHHPVNAALLAAGLATGLPLDTDQNASPEAAPGIGPTPTNMRDRERWSTARAYLDPAPAGLELRGRHHVTRVIVSRGQATGVEVLVDDRLEILNAGRIVLCAGAIATPQLLVRSGVGPAELLTASGGLVVHDSPVGAQLHDHPQVVVRFAVPSSLLDEPFETALGVSAHGSSGIDGAGSGDLEVLSVLRPLGRMLGTQPDDSSLSLLVSPLRSTGRGRLLLDTRTQPHLDFRYAETEPDRARLRAAVRLAATLLASDPMRALDAVPEHPQLTTLDDRSLDSWVLEHLSTALHSCGTTPMGADPATSVVDGRGAVHGIAGLHVADVGILPRTPTGGPAAAAVLIGEVIADALTD